MERDIGQTTNTALDTGVKDYSVSHETIDEAETKEFYWNNDKWPEYLGYYKSIPELRQAILALATWTAGKGYEADDEQKIELDNITGWGEDSFHSIMENLIVTKKINGDAYAEIIRNDNGDLVNLKPLNPFRMRTVVNEKGLIIRYDEMTQNKKEAKRKFQPKDILHVCNDRIANEIHGTSVIESVKWIIDARNEAMADWRRISHRSTIRVLYVDVDNSTQLTTLKNQYKDAIKNGEVLILPGVKGQDVGFEDLQLPPVEAFMRWIQYLENFFYQAVGVPKIILGGSQEFTEASSKIGYLTFEQVYAREQKLLEQDLWNQLAIKLEFNRPVSLKDNVQSGEERNTGQLGVQPSETQASTRRAE